MGDALDCGEALDPHLLGNAGVGVAVNGGDGDALGLEQRGQAARSGSTVRQQRA